MKNLQQSRWANFDEAQEALVSLEGEQPIRMSHSDGTALALLVDDTLPTSFGADVIRFEAGKGVTLHTHVGAHILLVTKGKGVLTYHTEEHPMFEGMIYLIPSNVPHAIAAETELVLIAIGNDHQAANSEDRLNVIKS